MENDNNFNIHFVGIGFPRCGTTWIGKCLREHPGIDFSSKKEVHFFNREHNFGKGIPFYKTFFSNKEGKVRGEFTPEYYRGGEELALRIKKMFPDVKLIFSMRDPAERAFSNYLYRKRKTGSLKSMREVFETEQSKPKNEKIIEPGFYYKHLEPFLKHFDRDDILPLIHDDSKKDPKAFIQKIYAFLGVDDTFIPKHLRKRTNTSARLGYKYPWIQYLYAKRMKILKHPLGGKIRDFLKMFRINKLVQKIIEFNSAPVKEGKKDESLSRADRMKLMALYKEDIEKLENLLGRDLSSWKT